MPGETLGFPPQRTDALLQRLTSELRARTTQVGQEAVTGRRTDPAAQLDGRIAEVLNMETRLASLAELGPSLALAETRAELTQASLDTLSTTSVDLANSMQFALETGTEATLASASLEARQALGQVTSSLNVTLGGRSLFAGDDDGAGAVAGSTTIREVATPLITAETTPADAYDAVADAFASTASGTPFNPTDPPGPDAIYFGGKGDAPSLEVAPGERIAHQARADAPTIRAILRDVAVLGIAYDETVPLDAGMREGLARRAVQGLRDNLESLEEIRAGIGIAQARIAEASANQAAEREMLNLRYLNLAGRDQVEAATEFQQVQSQLERLFLVTARLSQLSLASFLR